MLQHLQPLVPAAMEPVLGGRDDHRRVDRDGRHRLAAMEPVLGGRDDDYLDYNPSREAVGRRNGARPWRTGRHRRVGPGHGDEQGAAMEPVLGGRDDWPDPGRRGGDPAAAMEPVLGGRDDPQKPW